MEETKQENKTTTKKGRKAGKVILIILSVIIAFGLAAIALYQIPSIKRKYYPYVTIYKSKIVYFLRPPAKSVFSPSVNNTMDAAVVATLTAMAPTATPEPEPTPTPIEGNKDDEKVVVEVTPSPMPTAIPSAFALEGIVQEYQNWNSCGPANLKLAMGYWGWVGDSLDIERVIKPGWRDLNVSPSELALYANEHTDYKALVRYGGEIDLLKQLVAAGFPVIVERGYNNKGDWMGHYGVIDAYDDAQQAVHIPDTNHGNIWLHYEPLQIGWDQFAGTYIVVYQPEDEAKLMEVLGEQADPNFNYDYTMQKYRERLKTAERHEKYFLLNNIGELLALKKNYVEAAEMFDEAFTYYSWLPVDVRPWRMIWYQFGPYESYYYTGRYEDIVSLAFKTVRDANEPALPETFLWSGRANLKLGNKGTAIFEFKRALDYHPGYEPALAELEALGVEP